MEVLALPNTPPSTYEEWEKIHKEIAEQWLICTDSKSIKVIYDKSSETFLIKSGLGKTRVKLMRVGEGDVQTVTDLFSKGILSTKEEREELCNFLRAAKKEFSDYAVKYGKRTPGGVDFLWRAFNNPIALSWSSGSPSASLFHHVEEFDNTAESPFQARGAGQAEAVGGPADPSSSQQS
ncbi:hypothetical protein REG_0738 [Candidatus Regiella insecticola LSR1]|uniref:Uncharacterized protein n=1 Tax=Candidatus Regiella insecticola LSR1 TaxID=663321 RepID=E0WS21_9ENTR|nr:DUF2203 family protein [Candidatus Regiella insecticola]EFL92155.1 hypothetical protein REG_0738 [Candidatus Regiella insecticola LSR1]